MNSERSAAPAGETGTGATDDVIDTSTVPERSALDPYMEVALGVARQLAEMGMAYFIAEPAMTDEGEWDPRGGSGGCGYCLPPGWQHSVADPSVIDRWMPGQALCMVTGVGRFDVIDVDPRNGGDESYASSEVVELLPRIYATASTPSGGQHHLVGRLHVRKKTGWRRGIDVQAGDDDGRGRGFVFVAPTVKLSKVTGQPASYGTFTGLGGWSQIEETLLSDRTGERLASQITAGSVSHASRRPLSDPQNADEASERPTYAELSPESQERTDHYVEAAVAGITAEMRASAVSRSPSG